MSKTGFGQMYRQLSSKLLDLVVTPHVLGEVPTESTTAEQSTTDSNKLVCYVLQNYSRSNALVVDGETRRLHLKPALDPLAFGTYQEKIQFSFCTITKTISSIPKPIPRVFYNSSKR